MQWVDLQPFHQTMVSQVFPRSPEVLARYQAYQDDLKKRDLSMDQVIFERYFREASVHWVLDVNAFPYDLAPGIQHLTLWLHPDYSWSPQQITEILQQTLPDREYIIMKNSPQTQSVRSIPHFHIFMKED